MVAGGLAGSPHTLTDRIIMKITIAVALSLLLGMQPIPLHAQEAESSEIQRLIAQTLEKHPTVAAARQKLKAAKARIPQAKGWPDPVISAGANNYPFDWNPVNLSRFPMTQTKIGVTQKLPNPGTIPLKVEAAERRSDIAATSITAVRLQLSQELRIIYVRLSFLRERIAVLEELEQTLLRLDQLVSSKFESGLISLPSVLQVQTQIAEVRTKQLELEERLETGVAQLIWFTGAELQSGDLTLNRSQINPTVYKREDLFAEALEARPDYQKEKLEANLSETLAALYEKEMAPDFSLNFSYGYRWDLTDLWSANVSVTLPLHRDIRERQQVIEHRAESRMNQFELQAIERRVQSEINSTKTEIEYLTRQIRYFDDELLPSINVSLESLEAGFEANREPITDVLIMFTRRINTSLEKISAEERLALAVVRLDGIAGRIYPGGKE